MKKTYKQPQTHTVQLRLNDRLMQGGVIFVASGVTDRNGAKPCIIQIDDTADTEDNVFFNEWLVVQPDNLWED